jgi:hypothetical protein
VFHGGRSRLMVNLTNTGSRHMKFSSYKDFWEKLNRMLYNGINVYVQVGRQQIDDFLTSCFELDIYPFDLTGHTVTQLQVYIEKLICMMTINHLSHLNFEIRDLAAPLYYEKKDRVYRCSWFIRDLKAFDYLIYPHA